MHRYVHSRCLLRPPSSYSYSSFTLATENKAFIVPTNDLEWDNGTDSWEAKVGERTSILSYFNIWTVYYYVYSYINFIKLDLCQIMLGANSLSQAFYVYITCYIMCSYLLVNLQVKYQKFFTTHCYGLSSK